MTLSRDTSRTHQGAAPAKSPEQRPTSRAARTARSASAPSPIPSDPSSSPGRDDAATARVRLWVVRRDVRRARSCSWPAVQPPSGPLDLDVGVSSRRARIRPDAAGALCCSSRAASPEGPPWPFVAPRRGATRATQRSLLHGFIRPSRARVGSDFSTGRVFERGHAIVEREPRRAPRARQRDSPRGDVARTRAETGSKARRPGCGRARARVAPSTPMRRASASRPSGRAFAITCARPSDERSRCHC
jgi:hypothetical protein